MSLTCTIKTLLSKNPYSKNQKISIIILNYYSNKKPGMIKKQPPIPSTEKPVPKPLPEIDPADIELEPELKPEEELDIIPDEEDPLLSPPPYEEPAPGEGP